jgi:hypothetical protein
VIPGVHGSSSQEFGSSIILDFSTPIPSFLLIAITGEGGTPPLQVLSVGGDLAGLNWKRLAGGPIGPSIFTIEYWGAFTPVAIAADQVTITFNESAESAVSFIALDNVNPTPAGSVIGPSTVLNNLFVTFNASSPRSMLFAASISEPDDTEPVAPGLNTTVYEQPQASQFIRSTNSTLGGMLTMSTNGYTHGSTLYYLGLEILAVPCNMPAWGWEPDGSSKFREIIRPEASFDGGSSLLAGTWGWDPALPPWWHLPLPQATNSDILQLPIVPPPWGWEAIMPPSPGQIHPAGPIPEMLALLIPPVFHSLWGFEQSIPPQFRMPFPGAVNPGVFPSSITGAWGWEGSPPAIFRLSYDRPLIVDILPNPLHTIVHPWGWDAENRQPPTVLHGKPVLDDWWPPIYFNRVLPGGGYKPWYGWKYPEIYEDDDLRERLERTLYDIDEQLEALAAEEEEERRGTRIIVPELLPPGWQDDQGGWRDEIHDRSQRREEERRRQQQDPYRHVHYNFASDLDFGVRRRIIGILDRAEHRNVSIFGSEAFRTRENALVKGRFAEQGTNAWVIRLDARARLEIAREAVAEGFKLLSFDDTSLSFIHRPTFPWKPVLLGAGAGATIMGAGIFTGWLIWGRNQRR